MGVVTFDYFHIILASVHSRLYHAMSPSQHTFKPELTPLLPAGVGRKNIPFSVVPHQCKILWTPVYLVGFNCCSYSPISGWPTTSALALLLRAQLAIPWTLCPLFLLFLSTPPPPLSLSLCVLPQNMPSRSLSNFDSYKPLYPVSAARKKAFELNVIIWVLNPS